MVGLDQSPVMRPAMSIEATGLSIWWVAVCLVLASGALLFLLLPLCFSANYGPGPTLRETAAVPGAKAQIAWVAAVYLVGALIITAETTHLQWVTLTILSDGIDTDFAYRSLALAGGLGALAWGGCGRFLSRAPAADHPGAPFPAGRRVGLGA